jgi:hypothetical protein
MSTGHVGLSVTLCVEQEIVLAQHPQTIRWRDTASRSASDFKLLKFRHLNSLKESRIFLTGYDLQIKPSNFVNDHIVLSLFPLEIKK